MLEIARYELDNLQVPVPNLLPKLNEHLLSMTHWDVLRPSPARRQIDEAVFDALGLTTGEREAVYEGVSELVTNRKRRARSV